MDNIYEKNYHLVEKEHFWNLSRRNFILKLIKKRMAKKKHKILDIGCSTGILLDELNKYKNLDNHGIDISVSAIKVCQEKGIRNTKIMSGESLKFRDASFDLLIASDCLEHIKNDQKALKEWFRVLNQKGELVIFVPAFMFLWTNHDKLSHHFRRYSRNELKSKLESAGFQLKRISFWNCLLFIPILFTRKYFSFINSSLTNQNMQLKMPMNFINKILISILNFENNILKSYNSPVGVSLFAVCKKKHH